MPSSRAAGSYTGFIFIFFRNLHIVLHSGYINLHSQQSKRVPFATHPLQHLLFLAFFDNGHSNQCEVTPYCSFDLHISNEQNWTSFHVFVGNLYIFFGEMSV